MRSGALVCVLYFFSGVEDHGQATASVGLRESKDGSVLKLICLTLTRAFEDNNRTISLKPTGTC